MRMGLLALDTGLLVKALLVYVACYFIYFLPTFLGAFLFHRRQMGAIFILNLLLGWTVVGWVVALVWAFVEDKSAS